MHHQSTSEFQKTIGSQDTLQCVLDQSSDVNPLPTMYHIQVKEVYSAFTLTAAAYANGMNRVEIRSRT